MPQIGQFTREQSGYTGRVQTLMLDIELAIIPAEGDAENAPDYRVHHSDADGPEVGAAWKRTGEKAGDYLSVMLDDPALPQPIRANLFKTDAEDEHWALYWNRPAKRAEKRDERG